MKYPTALFAVALLSWGGAALAAEPPQGGEYMPPDQGQQQVSKEQLKQFSNAMDEVRSVQQEYSQEIQQAEDMEEAQTLQADAQEEMRSVVEDSGLSISQYNQIAQQLQNNPDLVQRLQDIRSP